MMRKILKTMMLILIILMSSNFVKSQKTNIYTDDDLLFKKGLELFDKGKYGSAQIYFNEIVNKYYDSYSDIKTSSEFYRAICAIELFNKDAEYLITRFIDEHPESPTVKVAYFQMGKFLYRDKKYKKAILWFEKVDSYILSDEESSEFKFKLGYSYYITDNFEKASKLLFEVKDLESKYSIPALYYYSHIAYQNMNYETALQGFEKLQNDELFGPIVPYYITQIYYYQKKFDKVIEYAPKLLDSSSTKRVPEISRVIGEAFFKTGKFKEAIPFLEKYKEKSTTFNREDIYELAFAYYKTKRYADAEKSFESIVSNEDSLSQNIYWILADCYIKSNDKNKARMAFSSASKLNYDKTIQEDAMFNYAKITYELSYTPFNEAIKAFTEYIKTYPQSAKLNEAYSYLLKVYLSTKNYKDALASLDSIKHLNSELEEAYQKIAFFRGLELFNNLDFNSAIIYFDKSLKYDKYNNTYHALCLYWKGESYYRLKKYEDAIPNYRSFLETPGSFSLDEYNLAHYNIGYCYLKQKDYKNSSLWFRKYVDKPKLITSKISGDACNRIGDCYYVTRDFLTASEYYQKAIDINLSEVDYSMLQSGLSLGLLKEYNKKIEILTKLIKTYPESNFVPEAYYEIGNSYFALNSKDEAITNFQTILNKYPESSYVQKANLKLGLIYYNNDLNEDALRAYKEVVKNSSGTSEARDAINGLKNVYIDMNDIDGYVNYLKEIGDSTGITYSEQDSLTYSSIEKLLGDCPKLKDALNKYIEKFPNGIFIINAHFYKAECNYEANEKEEALKSYSFIIDKPKNKFTEKSLVVASELNYMNKNYDAALINYIQLEKIAENNNNLLNAIIGKFRCYYYIKNYPEAINAGVPLLAIKKIKEETIREIHYLLGKSYYANNQLDEALNEFKIIGKDTKNIEGAESKFTISAIYFAKNKFDLAEEEVFDFIKVNTPHQFWLAKSFLLLSDIYVQKKDYFQTKQTLQSIIDNYDGVNDGIIDTANSKLKAVTILENKLKQTTIDTTNYNINYDDKTNKNFNSLFDVNTVDTLKIKTNNVIDIIKINNNSTDTLNNKVNTDTLNNPNIKLE